MTIPTNSISMVDAQAIIMACYANNEPLMLLGKPGMGKTALYESVCHDLGIGFIDFRLSMRDPVDVGGMRVPDLKTGKLKHYVPDDLPDVKKHGPKGIILFDEINVVGQMMQATAYGIINERRNGSYTMASGWVPMASGNNVGDRAAAQRMSTALANRFNVQVVEPDVKAWLQQYGATHVDTRGTAFLRFRPELFHVMPEIDQTSFPSARSWTKAFKFIDCAPQLRRKIFAGYVGPDAAGEFEAFWRILENAPSMDDILANPKTATLPGERDVGTMYAVTSMIARSADRRNFDKAMIYVGRMPKDYQVATVQDATRRQPDLMKTRAYTDWAVENQDVTL
jgi:hypothetical protein